MQTKDSFLWVEKYRPQRIEDCILPDSLDDTFNSIVASGEMQNLLLSGGPGCGKTTVAKALCEELDMDWTIINCSEDGNIDTLRTKIREFASTVSLTGNKKAVILDEFDYSNPQSMQPALRGLRQPHSHVVPDCGGERLPFGARHLVRERVDTGHHAVKPVLPSLPVLEPGCLAVVLRMRVVARGTENPLAFPRHHLHR
ncbi:MAG: AAA family ATPase [Actinobacteria bacterium]|nr:AAA family ATPase [Actinomycetota bacterium]